MASQSYNEHFERKWQKATKGFGTIKVRHESRTDDQCVILNFATREAYDQFRREHMKSVATVIVDEFWGAALYNDPKEAWAAVRAFCRPQVTA